MLYLTVEKYYMVNKRNEDFMELLRIPLCCPSTTRIFFLCVIVLLSEIVRIVLASSPFSLPEATESMRKDEVQTQNDEGSVQNSSDTSAYAKVLKAGLTGLQKGVGHER